MDRRTTMQAVAQAVIEQLAPKKDAPAKKAAAETTDD